MWLVDIKDNYGSLEQEGQSCWNFNCFRPEGKFFSRKRRKTMRHKGTIWMAMALGVFLFAAVAQAEIGLPPEDFESYSAGDFTVSGPPNWVSFVAGNTFTILDDGTNGTNTLRVEDPDNSYADFVWDNRLEWDVQLLQTISVDFNLADTPGDLGGTGTYARTGFQYGGTYKIGEVEIQRTATGSYAYVRNEAIPGGTSLNFDTWYTVEAEYDMVAKKTRARLGPAGGAMGAWSTYHDWSALGVAKPTYVYFNRHIGGVEYDNVSLTPEPTTVVLLSAGSLLLIRRKRR